VPWQDDDLLKRFDALPEVPDSDFDLLDRFDALPDVPQVEPPDRRSGLNLTDLITGKKSGGGKAKQFVEGLGEFPGMVEKYVTPKYTLDKEGKPIPYLPERPRTEPQTMGEKAARMAGTMVSYTAGMPLGAAIAPQSIPAGMAIGAGENVVASVLDSVAEDASMPETVKRAAIEGTLGAAIPGTIGVGAKVLRRGARGAKAPPDIPEVMERDLAEIALKKAEEMAAEPLKLPSPKAKPPKAETRGNSRSRRQRRRNHLKSHLQRR
jgi:hypothetical protein